MGVAVQEQSNGNAMATIAASPGSGLALRNLDDMWRFAQAVAKSGMAPKGMDRPESVLIALQMGAELGLPPMASLQNIAVINGRPSIWGDAMLAVCRASGHFDEEAFEEREEGDGKNLKAVCVVRRLPRGKPVVRSFSMDDAAKAGLLGKSGPWKEYTRRMLQMRARSWALRDCFSDVLRGIGTIEENRDIVDVPSTVVSRDPSRSKLDALADRLAAPRDDVRPVETPQQTTLLPDGELVDPETLEEIERACKELHFNGVRLESHLQATYGVKTTSELTRDQGVDFREHVQHLLETEPKE